MCFDFRRVCCAGLLALCLLPMGCKRRGGGSVANPNNPAQPTSTDEETSEGNNPSEPGSTTPDDSYDYSGHAAVYLDQGWNEDQREQFYYLGQGSQIIPYNWFVSLELPDREELLTSDRYMASLGFITQSPSGRNPDGLPIGFVKDSNPSTITMKAAFLGPDFNLDHFPRQENDWLGLTCAACHTADLMYKQKVIRIDGGAAMADVQSLLTTIAESMRATVSDDAKFASFASRVQERAGGSTAEPPSREEVESFAVVLEQLVERNKAPHPYGLARLDAFGAILNQIAVAAVQIPENRRPSSAPVSYPFLWDASHLDWVQWNSSAEIPIARNVGEVLGVFAHIELTDDPEAGYPSSARLDYLHDLELSLRELKAPPWPADQFGDIDTAKAAAGKVLFADNCAHCHNTRDESGNFAMTPPNEAGNRFIKTTSIPFSSIGTDPQMVLNVATRTAKPGILASAVSADLAQLEASGGLERVKQLRAKLGMPAPDFSQEVPAALLLKAAVRGVTKYYLEREFQNLTDEQKQAIVLDLRGGHVKDNPPPNGGIGYKARPLDGVWATAPFLHNGSVPNLWELLKPDKDRVKSFHVGSREFDPIHVGLSTEPVAGAFHFQTVAEDGTPIPGNSNLGHSGDQHTGAGGVDFTDDQRWAIIEYIKTLQ